MSVSVAMETLLYRAGSADMQRSEGGKREVGGEERRTLANVGEKKQNRKPNSRDKIEEECFLETWHQVELESWRGEWDWQSVST